MNPDCLVIGAGINGLATALSLAQAGMRVCVVERGAVGGESTWAGAGVLSLLLPWNYPPPVNLLAERGRVLWPEWIDRLRATVRIDPEYRSSGLLVLGREGQARAEAWGRQYGRRVESPPERLAASCVQPDGGLWLPEVAQVRNPRLTRLIEAALGGMGVEVLPDTPVLGLERQGGRLTGARTPNARFAFGQVVVCAGAWTPGVLADQAAGLQIHPIRGQILLFRSRPDRLPCVVYADGHYLVPRADGLVLAGSTLEDAGFDKSVTLAARDELLRFATAVCPDLEQARIEVQWAGLRPGSPDNIPTIARHPEIENLYVNSGHFRYGVTMAPASAELLTCLMTGRTPLLDPTPYAWRQLDDRVA